MSGRMRLDSSDDSDETKSLEDLVLSDSSSDEDAGPRKHERTRRQELNFLKELLSVLRSAYNYFDDVVKKLGLVEFANGDASFSTLLTAIKSQNISVANYQELRGIANSLTIREPMLLHVMRREIKRFIDTEVKVDSFFEDGKRIVEFKAKLINSRNLPSFMPELDEVHIICDTLHVDGSLSQLYRGKNLAIYSKVIDVHTSVIWDLSGRDGESADDAREKESSMVTGDGAVGEDGIAGESEFFWVIFFGAKLRVGTRNQGYIKKELIKLTEKLKKKLDKK
jgi:hypothetical protein